MNKKSIFVLMIVLLLAMAITAVAGAAGKGPAEPSQEDVVTFMYDGLYDDEHVAGHSNMVRKNDGVQIQVTASELIPGGVYTFWLLADEYDDAGFPWDLIIWIDDVVVGSNGKYATNLMLGTGADGIAGNPQVYRDEGEDGLNDPYGAGIEIEIVYHGQVEDLPDDPVEASEWFTTFWVGGPGVCTIELGIPEVPDMICPLAQLSYHGP